MTRTTGETATRETVLPTSPIPVANVAQVPQRSPLRYPGGKTWLVPHIRAWLGALESPQLLIEPFAGGGTTSLTAIMEGLAPNCLMVELDQDVADFWDAALHHNHQLIRQTEDFTPTRENLEALERQQPETIAERGFRTLALNRTRHSGILAKGAALARNGENGRGVASRWYPRTIRRRLMAIARHARQIDFLRADGMAVLEDLLDAGMDPGRTAIFVDPPYTAEGKRAGRRLYTHNEVDHARLFDLLDRIANKDGEFLATYDESPEIMNLVAQHGFHAVRVMMKNAHHRQVPELVITKIA